MLWALTGLLAVVVLVGMAAYVPAVQRFAVEKVSQIVARRTGTVLSVERLRVRFPIGVEARGVTVVTPVGDTIARVEAVRGRVSLPALLRSKVAVSGIRADNAASVYRDTSSGMVVRVEAGTLALAGMSLDPAARSIVIRNPDAARVDVSLSLGTGGRDTDRKKETADPAWTIDIRRFELSDVRYAMSTPSPGADAPDRFEIDVADADGDFAMTGGGFRLENLALSTARSHIRLDARVDMGAGGMDPTTALSASLSAGVATDDVLARIPAAMLDGDVRRVLEGKTVMLAGTFGGTLGEVSTDDLTVSVPGNMDLALDGRIRSVADPENISGEVAFEGTLADVDFTRSLIPDPAVRRRFALPGGMRLRGEGSFSADAFDLFSLTLDAGGGRLDGSGHFSTGKGSYTAAVKLTGFPLDDFLPQDSLGAATVSLDVRGRGFDPLGGMNARVDVEIDSVEYRGVVYRGLKFDAGLSDGDMDGRLTSCDAALSLDVTAHAKLRPGDVRAEVRGSVRQADLRAMRMAGDTLSFATIFDISAEAVTDTVSGTVPGMRYTLSAAVDSTLVRFGSDSVAVAAVSLSASASRAGGTTASVRSGDFSLDLASPLRLDSLAKGARSVAGEVARQLAARHLSADSLQSAFPGVTLTARAGRGNFLREMMRMDGFDFRTVSVDVSTAPGAPFHIEGEVTGLETGKFTIDTIEVSAFRNGSRLDYLLRVANRPGNNDDLGSVEVSGSAGGNTASVDLYQRNRRDSVGFRFGVEVGLQGSSLHGRITPADPVFGYEQWEATGTDNGFEYDFEGRLRADIHLDNAAHDKHIYITSASLADNPDGSLRLELSGIDLAPVLDLFPASPPVGGKISSDVIFGLHRRDQDEKWIVAAKGALGVSELSYDRRHIADIDATVDFRSDTADGMALTAAVMLDKSTALTAEGHYAADGMDFTVSVPAVPLSIVDNFLPSEFGTVLSGSFGGKVRVTGTAADPVFTGDVGFTDGTVDAGMLGTRFAIATERISMSGGRIVFDGFGVTSPGNRKLSLDGSVDIADVANPRADLRLSTRGFQIVNSRHIGGSQIYGTAAFDADVTARGAPRAMTVRGDISLSESTNMVYILRNRSRVRDEKQHIVEFKAFADSIYNDTPDEAVPSIRRRGVDMLVGVAIPQGVRATVSLDELNENRVELTGGGDLSFSMNTQGDVRLAGRYTLTDGTVYYRPPMISQKIFAVADGSYVEWTGEATNPEFHITATQSSETELSYDDGSVEMVDFDISLDISGSLGSIDMRFDLAAPGNIAIQNQLLSMDVEQRMQQALTLLIYGQYTGPGVSSKGASLDARKQINDFITKEVNQWARNNLKGVDFSMGIDTRTGTAGDTHTDYSYSVSGNVFSDRVKVSVGGRVSDNAVQQNFANDLIDDITLEYRLTRRDNMFLKLYRYNTRASILEGEVTETGGGFMLRKKLNRFGDLFRRTGRAGKTGETGKTGKTKDER